MKIESWNAVYRSERNGNSIVVRGFSTRAEAESFVADDKTDTAIHVRLGWTRFERIEFHEEDVDECGFADDVLKQIACDGCLKTVTFGRSRDGLYREVARLAQCELWASGDHFDSFVVFLPRGGKFHFPRDATRLV